MAHISRTFIKSTTFFYQKNTLILRQVSCSRGSLPSIAINVFRQGYSTQNFKSDTAGSQTHEGSNGRNAISEKSSSNYPSKINKALHKPVMVDTVVNVIDPKPGQVIVDMTFGAGGHTLSLLKRCADITVYALDRDPCAQNLAVQLSQSCSQIKPLLGRFTDLKGLLAQQGVTQIDAALLDAGASSMQYDSDDRGFSISRTSPLDMRMDGNRLSDQVTAEDVVNYMDVEHLYKIIKHYGEEKHARSIAHAIAESRRVLGRITTTTQLANIIASACYGQQIRLDKLGRSSHVATKTFQALRIFVNNELNELHNGLEDIHSFLRSGGVCAVLSFHSLEDRIVKRLFHGIDVDAPANMSVTDRYRNPAATSDVDDIERLIAKNKWLPMFDRKLIICDETEIKLNPRARSAKLRAATKL